MVIYHGKDEWKAKTTLGQMIEGYESLPLAAKKHVPDYEYLLYDISKYTDDEIKGEAQLRILLTIFRDIFTKDTKVINETVLRAAEHLRELDNQQTGLQYFETFMKYVLYAGQNLTKEDIEEMINKVESVYPEGRDMVMSLAEQLKQEGREEGIIKGMEAGMEKGTQKKAIAVARKLFKMNMTVEQVADATDLTEKEVAKIKEQVKSR